MERRVVITGLGVVAPKALGVNEFYSKIKDGKNLLSEIKTKGIYDLGIHYGGVIDYPLPNEQFGGRYIKQCDIFSIYALHACKEALEDSGIDLNDIDKSRFGVYVGNSAGGWNSAQSGLFTLHTEGVKKISPYIASNWFPAAPQGHISIYFKLKGVSKTVAADTASSIVSIGNAYRMIASGRADFMLAGGSENILVPWGLMFYRNSGRLKMNADSEFCYRPYAVDSQGMTICDGSAFLMLEEREHAIALGCHIYGEIAGYQLRNEGNSEKPKVELAECISGILGSEKPDVVYVNGTGVPDEDSVELEGIQLALGSDASNTMLCCPKSFYGHGYGAAGAMDTVLACKAMDDNCVLPSGEKAYDMICSQDKFVFGRSVKKDISSTLVLGRGTGGINAGILIKK